MPYRKRTMKRRLPRKGNKKYKRYYRKQIGGLQMSYKREVHHFKQLCRPSANTFLWTDSTGQKNGQYVPADGFMIGPSDTADDNFYFAIKFHIADVQTISGLGSLFDSYRINKVVVTFTPAQNVNSGASLGTPADLIPPMLCTVIDRDDASIPTSLPELEQYQTFKQTPSTKKHTIVITPALAQQAYKSSGTTIAYTQTYKKWCDFATTDVDHYGIHGCVTSNSTAANNWKAAWYVRVKYYFSCKTVR